MNFNRAVIVGNVTQDPEIRSTPSGQQVANFSVATNRYWTDRDTNQRQEKTEFHNVVAWRRLAEIAGKFLTKGSLVMVEGRIETRTWEGQDGNRRYKTEIIAENMQLGPRGGGQGNTGSTQQKDSAYDAGSSKKKEDKKDSSDDRENIPTIDEDETSGYSNSDDEVDVKDIPF